MFVNIKLEIVAVGIDYFVTGHNRYAIDNHFHFLIRIIPFVYTHPEDDSAFSTTANFGFANANHRIFAFLVEKFAELVGDFGQNFYIEHFNSV